MTFGSMPKTLDRVPPSLLDLKSPEDLPRLLHVRITASDHALVRSIAFQQNVRNAQVVAWSLELLRQHVTATETPEDTETTGTPE